MCYLITLPTYGQSGLSHELHSESETLVDGQRDLDSFSSRAAAYVNSDFFRTACRPYKARMLSGVVREQRLTPCSYFRFWFSLSTLS